MTWVLDLDGVVWRGSEPIPGSVDAISRLQQSGVRVTFVSNNSFFGAADHRRKLAAMGVDVNLDDIISARDLLVQRIGSGRRVLCASAEGLSEALVAAGNTVYRVDEFVNGADAPSPIESPPEVDFVVAGTRFDLTYLHLSVPARAVLQCRQLIAPNLDPLYPHESGIYMGTGSIIAALERAGDVEAEVIGKPERTMVDEVHRRLPDATLLVGDQLETDGELARRAGIPFAYVASGVGAIRGLGPLAETMPVAYSKADLATLVRDLV